STGWLSPEQVAEICPNEDLQRVLTGGCYTTIISPEGVPLCEPITEGEGIAIADLDFSLITKRKRMMDSVGHYSRPDLLQLKVNQDSYTVWQQTNSQNNNSTSSIETAKGRSQNSTNEEISNDSSPTLPFINQWTNEN
ncbi:MAG: aliphatic nitrilase, partial [Cyanobacteria bacterium J06648_1]